MPRICSSSWYVIYSSAILSLKSPWLLPSELLDNPEQVGPVARCTLAPKVPRLCSCRYDKLPSHGVSQNSLEGKGDELLSSALQGSSLRTAIYRPQSWLSDSYQSVNHTRGELLSTIGQYCVNLCALHGPLCLPFKFFSTSSGDIPLLHSCFS